MLVRLPPAVAVRAYSLSRQRFLTALSRRPPRRAVEVSGLDQTLWGLRFRSPLMNAAGMFKNGEGYALSSRQGAGGYLAGTTTHRRRSGNRRHGVALPFAPYPRSGAASNWLGLPNIGHQEVAQRLALLSRVKGCPIGASVAACPDPKVGGEEKLTQLVAALAAYEAAGVDFLEVNESCPNTADDPGGLEGVRARLRFLADGFLSRRQRRLPVIVKLSCDTAIEDIDALLEILVGVGFDGVNFGNTSIAYERHRDQLDASETRLFDFFTRSFGGGLSGRPLKVDSLRLVKAAASWLRNRPAGHEFHVVRTGGVECVADIEQSFAAGASLCQWYSGYFESFGRHGHWLYRELYSELKARSNPVSRPGR